MGDIDAKILCKTIDINNIVSIKLIVYGLLKTQVIDKVLQHNPIKGKKWTRLSLFKMASASKVSIFNTPITFAHVIMSDDLLYSSGSYPYVR